MKKVILIAPLMLLAACGPKIKLVPTPYMPTPPEILMRSPKEINTIRQNNLTVTDKDVTVEGPK